MHTQHELVNIMNKIRITIMELQRDYGLITLFQRLDYPNSFTKKLFHQDTLMYTKHSINALFESSYFFLRVVWELDCNIFNPIPHGMCRSHYFTGVILTQQHFETLWGPNNEPCMECWPGSNWKIIIPISSEHVKIKINMDHSIYKGRYLFQLALIKKDPKRINPPPSSWKK